MGTKRFYLNGSVTLSNARKEFIDMMKGVAGNESYDLIYSDKVIGRIDLSEWVKTNYESGLDWIGRDSHGNVRKHPFDYTEREDTGFHKEISIEEAKEGIRKRLARGFIKEGTEYNIGIG